MESGMKKLLLSVALLFSLTALARQSKLAPDLPQNANDGVDVIVRYTALPDQGRLDRIGQHGGRVVARLDIAKAVLVHMPASKLADLASDPDVAYISPDRPVAATSWFAALRGG